MAGPVGGEVTGLHHVGVVTGHLARAVQIYRGLGFTVGEPMCTVLPATGGGTPQPLGVVNAHIELAGGFVEIAAVIDDAARLPEGTRTLPVEVPDTARAGVLAAARTATATLAAGLAQFPGLHILMFASPQAEQAASRLAREGIAHNGVHPAQRPVETPGGVRMEPVQVLEIAGDDGEGIPEGRVGIASTPAVGDRPPRHPNGARALVECWLCVDDTELDRTEARYTVYTGRQSERDGPQRRFILDAARVTLVPASATADLRLGEHPRPLPAFVGYAVEVDDLEATRRFLDRAGFSPAVAGPDDAVVVPAEQALGAAVIFRGPGQGRR